MHCTKGDIVLVPFPFTDLSSVKTRPAVVVSDNLPGDNVVLVLITSNTKTRPFSVRITAGNKKMFAQSGLKVSSVVCTDNIGSFDKRILIGRLGSLDKVLLKEVDIQLRRVLGF